VGSWDFQSYAFQQGFETLWDHARADRSGLLIQPMLSLWRQSIELSLKAAIIYIAGEIPGNPGHKLDALFSELIAAISSFGLSVDDHLTASVSDMIALAQSIDPIADRFRYPTNKKGEVFERLSTDLDELFQAHWIIVTYCEGAAIEVEALRGSTS
ncbi:hypothetical protein VM77_06130, partial [Citromicrobium sp. JL31]